MIAAVFRVMLLGVLRDRGAFAMAFVLPPLIYVIFASIFSVAAGGDLRVKVAIVDQAGTEASSKQVAEWIGQNLPALQANAPTITWGEDVFHFSA